MNAPLNVGDAFTRSVTITPEVYNAFVRCSGDINPLHADDVYAQSQGYPGKLMHGALLHAIVSGFVGTGLPTSKTLCLSQRISYRKPFFLNDVITLVATCSNLQETPMGDAWLASFSLRFMRGGGTAIANGALEVRLGQ